MDRVYEDYEPYHEWAKDEGLFTFMIPGYRKDQLKVQVTSKPALKLKGERQIVGNKWRRFEVEFPIPPDYDLDSVSAKFEGGRLNIKFSKLAKPKEETTTNPKEETSRPKEEAEESQKKVDQQNAKKEEGTPKEKEDKAESKSNEKVSEQKTPQKEEKNVSSDEKEKSKTETEDSIEKVAKKENGPSDEKGKSKTEDSTENVAKEDKTSNNGITDKKEAGTTKAPETKDAKPMSRFKTRLLDFGPSLGSPNQAYNEELGDSNAGTTKLKRWVNCGLMTLLAIGLGLYAKNTFMRFHGGPKSEDL